MPVWPDLAKELDQLIREGNVGIVRTRLRKTGGRVPREHRATFAGLSGRAGLAALGMRLLGPIVRPDRRVATEPTAAERAEYAYLLVRLGAVEEALALLATVDRGEYPPAAFYEAAARIHRWDYAAAIPLLERYVRRREISKYQKLVAEVNLAGALVNERRYRDASYLLRELLYETGIRKLWLLHGNLLQFAAGNCLFQRRFEEAAGFLDKAAETLRESPIIDEFFVRKWRAILGYVEGKGGAAPRERLTAIRREAEERGHWETVRDCDRFRCMHDGDATLFLRLHFGTPYPAFRARLIQDFPGRVPLPESYVWNPHGPAAVEAGLDAGAATIGAGAPLPRFGSLHRLLLALVSDFYRPFRLVSLFERLFPGEHYRPSSSLPRVHQAIRLLRRRFADEGIVLDVAAHGGEYRLEAGRDFGVRVSGEPVAADPAVERLNRLRLAWPQALFSTEEARRVLGLSYRTAHRVIEEALRAGQLERVGKTSLARYRFRPT